MPGIGNLLPCLSLLCRRALQDRETFATLSLPLPPFIAMITLATIVPLIGWMLETLLLSQIKQLQCCKHTGPHSNCLCPCQYGRKQLTRKTRSMKNCTACPWSWMQDHKECYYEGTPLGNQRLARQRGRPNWQRRTREPNWEATQQTMEFIDQPSDIAQSVIPHSGTRQQHSTEEATYFDWHRVVWLRWDYQTLSASDQCSLYRWCQYGKITHLLKAWSMVEDLEVSAQSSPALASSASISVPISSICSSKASSRVCSSSQCHVCSKDRLCFFQQLLLGNKRQYRRDWVFSWVAPRFPPSHSHLQRIAWLHKSSHCTSFGTAEPPFL